MDKLARILLVTAAIGLVAGFADTVRANHPTYIVLRVPASPAERHPTYGYYPGRQAVATARTYSYGWFGVKTRRHWSRHSGYHNHYREWSAR